MKDTRTKSVP